MNSTEDVVTYMRGVATLFGIKIAPSEARKIRKLVEDRQGDYLCVWSRRRFMGTLTCFLVATVDFSDYFGDVIDGVCATMTPEEIDRVVATATSRKMTPQDLQDQATHVLDCGAEEIAEGARYLLSPRLAELFGPTA